MDRNRIEYIARLPHGEPLVQTVLNGPIEVDDPIHRFGVEEMLRASRTEGVLASLLCFFGVLTYGGHGLLDRLELGIPNLVVRKLYGERIQESPPPSSIGSCNTATSSPSAATATACARSAARGSCKGHHRLPAVPAS